jgi:hypothetical protein
MKPSPLEVNHLISPTPVNIVILVSRTLIPFFLSEPFCPLYSWYCFKDYDKQNNQHRNDSKQRKDRQLSLPPQ